MIKTDWNCKTLISAEFFQSKIIPFLNKLTTFDTEMIKYLISELSSEIIYIEGCLEYKCMIMYFYINLGLKKLENFCKQFSHFEILKMTRPLKLKSRLIVFLNFSL